MSADNILKLGQIIFSDKILQTELQKITDREEFINKVAELGKTFGFEFSIEEIRQMMQENQRGWIERWI
jgi:hypothetical protein